VSPRVRAGASAAPSLPFLPALCWPGRLTCLPPGLAAKAIHVCSYALAILYAQCALLVQLHALLRANQFLHRYRWAGWAGRQQEQGNPHTATTQTARDSRTCAPLAAS
jgi:hypothetical protein